jgi:hypothetical protein
VANNPLRVNNSDVYNPLKTITVLLYRTTDQGLGIFVANSSTSRFGKASKNITDGRFVPYITGCVVNFNINMK